MRAVEAAAPEDKNSMVVTLACVACSSEAGREHESEKSQKWRLPSAQATTRTAGRVGDQQPAVMYVLDCGEEKRGFSCPVCG
jgi:hypothetical protein